MHDIVLLIESDWCIKLLWVFVNKCGVFYNNLILEAKMSIDISNCFNLISQFNSLYPYFHFPHPSYNSPIPCLISLYTHLFIIICMPHELAAPCLCLCFSGSVHIFNHATPKYWAFTTCLVLGKLLAMQIQYSSTRPTTLPHRSKCSGERDKWKEVIIIKLVKY